VVGVLLMEGEEDNPAYADIFANLPAEEGEPEATELTVSALDLMPEVKTYYTYTGSLTTPPCSQGVRWILLTTPIELSATQIEAFQTIFAMNARPVQELNQRDLLEDSN
jgi:carbonic anhydrase